MVQLDEKTYQELLQSRQTQAEKITVLEAEVGWYREQLGLAKKRLYGPKSEASPVGQEEMLFNEAEACASPVLPDPETEVVTYTRRKTAGKREQQLADLPQEEIEYELAAEEQICPKCEGALHKMGTDTRQEIKIIPAQVILVKHNRAKYACRACEDNAESSPVLVAPFPKPEPEVCGRSAPLPPGG
jgi:transposase